MKKATKKMTTENTTPAWYAGPGEVARRKDRVPPIKSALKKRLKK